MSFSLSMAADGDGNQLVAAPFRSLEKHPDNDF
jgi:hypothetical protein